MKKKHILIAAGVGITGLLAFGYNKVKTLQSTFEKMTIKPVDISDLKWSVFEIKFKLDLKIDNPTKEYFAISGASVARLKTISVYRKGKFIGTANVELEAIEIPPYSHLVLKHVPFSVSAANVLYNALTIETFSLSQLTIVATIDVLGNEYIIES